MHLETSEALQLIMSIQINLKEIYNRINLNKQRIAEYYALLERYVNNNLINHTNMNPAIFNLPVTIIAKTPSNIVLVNPNILVTDTRVINNLPIRPWNPNVVTQAVTVQNNQTILKDYMFGLVDPLILNILIARNVFHMFVYAIYAIQDMELRNLILSIIKLSLTGDSILPTLLTEYIFSTTIENERSEISLNNVIVKIDRIKTFYTIDYRILYKFSE